MEQTKKFDIVVVGGGLAGLSLAIQGAREGFSVLVCEKEAYPFHKVCGEYISLESWDFLEELGVPLSEWDLPIIRKLELTAPDGFRLLRNMPQGGFGISRYLLDATLADIARANGAVVSEHTRVEDVVRTDSGFTVSTGSESVHAKVVAGTWGKRSNMDVKKKRAFVDNRERRLTNYIGIKYHVNYPQLVDTISLHNFKGGYCGISKIEGDRYCLCYLTTASNLRAAGNSIKEMEKTILSRNPFLKTILTESEYLYESPLSIAQISFAKKELILEDILLIGDAAGMITPLCGNGMSMALHASKMAFETVRNFLEGKESFVSAGNRYREMWQHEFAKRLRTGRAVQRFFGDPLLTGLLLRSVSPFPRIIDHLIRSTHGQPF